MLKRLIPVLALSASASVYAAGGNDDPLLAMLKIDQLEVRDTGDEKPRAWKVDAWLGKDLNKLWFKTEGEVVNGETEDAEVQLLYSRAVSPFWDFQIGARRDLEPKPERNWLALGFSGLAPYLLDVDTSLFIGAKGKAALRLDAEYEYMLTQRLVLIPEIEANLYNRDDAERAIGKGLSDLTLGVRLAYEVRREFAPYVGYTWTGLYGDTADYARAAGADTSTGAWVAGIKAWF